MRYLKKVILNDNDNDDGNGNNNNNNNNNDDNNNNNNNNNNNYNSNNTKYKTVKTKDKIRRFGVFMTPLSRKILKRSCKLQHLKRFWREELTKEGVKIVKIFKKIIKILSHEWSLLVR